jgi:hypothetical protein
MASIRNLTLKCTGKTSDTATLKATFTIRQNQQEQEMSNLRWECYYRYYAVDEGGAKSPIWFTFIRSFNSTNERDMACEIVNTIDRSILDEDPWWQVWKDTNDEICIKIRIEEKIWGIYGDEATSDWIREQFG